MRNFTRRRLLRLFSTSGDVYRSRHTSATHTRVAHRPAAARYAAGHVGILLDHLGVQRHSSRRYSQQGCRPAAWSRRSLPHLRQFVGRDLTRRCGRRTRRRGCRFRWRQRRRCWRRLRRWRHGLVGWRRVGGLLHADVGGRLVDYSGIVDPGGRDFVLVRLCVVGHILVGLVTHVGLRVVERSLVEFGRFVDLGRIRQRIVGWVQQAAERVGELLSESAKSPRRAGQSASHVAKRRRCRRCRHGRRRGGRLDRRGRRRGRCRDRRGRCSRERRGGGCRRRHGSGRSASRRWRAHNGRRTCRYTTARMCRLVGDRAAAGWRRPGRPRSPGTSNTAGPVARPAVAAS